MHQGSGFLTTRQRRLAWIGFLLAAVQAPVSARLVADSSWLFSLCVALMVATVIIADDAARRRPLVRLTSPPTARLAGSSALCDRSPRPRVGFAR
ncbi:hypothetical protein [Micromonospora maris]|uniref:hypothetical protein n=1 Tax=Micromonospora maris TaxID=1003110 RepID=UPI000206AE2D|nr:hypothetical protein [Micromonospora maris]AEB43968.1 hypothetical protein VAB18032_14280 [Micromonospora maris AB-18-032]